MFEGLKKGFAQGKAEAAESERKQKIKKYVAAEKKSIAERKKQISAKPSKTTIALGKMAYHADKYAESAGRVTGKIVAGGKKIVDKIPEPPKQKGKKTSSSGGYKVNDFVLGRGKFK
jgi:hypothetical protein